ncbi:hypothetical protein H8959_007415 [Pygathrix nigripes]
MEIALVPLENGGAMTVRGGNEARAGCGQATGGVLQCPPTAGLSDGPKEPAPKGRGAQRDADPGVRPLPPLPKELPQPRRPPPEDEEEEGDPGLGTVEDQALGTASLHHQREEQGPQSQGLGLDRGVQQKVQESSGSRGSFCKAGGTLENADSARRSSCPLEKCNVKAKSNVDLRRSLYALCLDTSRETDL